MSNKQKNQKMVVHPASIDMLVDSTWEFAHKILWNELFFGRAETALAKSYIREYYSDIPAKKFSRRAFKNHTRLCERILRAKGNASAGIAHPCIFFNKLNPKGLFHTTGFAQRLFN